MKDTTILYCKNCGCPYIKEKWFTFLKWTWYRERTWPFMGEMRRCKEHDWDHTFPQKRFQELYLALEDVNSGNQKATIVKIPDDAYEQQESMIQEIHKAATDMFTIPDKQPVKESED